MRYGERVVLVNNSNNTKNAAYQRLKKGEFSRYMITWCSYDRNFVEARYINPNNKLTTAYYTFPLKDVAPTTFINKKLEDYL